MNLIYFPIIISLFGIIFAWFLVSKSKKSQIATDKIVATTTPHQNGAWFSFKNKYKKANITGAVLFFIFLVTPILGWRIALGFLVGAILSELVGLICLRRLGACFYGLVRRCQLHPCLHGAEEKFGVGFFLRPLGRREGLPRQVKRFFFLAGLE